MVVVGRRRLKMVVGMRPKIFYQVLLNKAEKKFSDSFTHFSSILCSDGLLKEANKQKTKRTLQHL